MLTKINIAAKLHAIAERNATNEIAESESILESVSGHLANTDAETIKMLNLFATGKQVEQVRSKVESSKKVLTEKHVTGADIKDVCVKYNLRFLPVRLYAKSVPFAALDDLRKFKETFKETFKEGVYRYTDEDIKFLRLNMNWSNNTFIPTAQPPEAMKYFHEDRLFIIAPLIILPLFTNL